MVKSAKKKKKSRLLASYFLPLLLPFLSITVCFAILTHLLLKPLVEKVCNRSLQVYRTHHAHMVKLLSVAENGLNN